MKFQTLGNKKQFVSATVKNVDTVTIPRGAPVFLKPTTTGVLGLDVVSSISLADANQGFFFGIALADIAANRLGDAGNFGIIDTAVAVATRSASSAVWASYVAVAIGDVMQFSTALLSQAVIRSGAGSASNQFWLIQAASSYASFTTQASSIGGASLVSTSLMKAMIRSM